ncbi:MAG: DUF2474 domain-containing protein [Blastomonas sp.]
MALPEDPAANRPLWQKLGWMALIWAGSVALLGTIAYVLRWWLGM